ncbi:MAG: DUF1573 domain-containing protein [Sedimentisphaerales bacterium]
MKNGKLNLIAGIIVFVLVLQGWFASQAIGAQAPASKTAAEANAVSPQVKAQPKATAEPNAAEPNGPPPKLIFEEPTHDFGSVAPGSLTMCKFKFANKGEGVLKISEVTKTCGCTVFTLDKKEYAPGEEGVIDAGYNADKGSGVRTRHLYVMSNDPVNPRIELTIKAAIVQKIVYEPEKLEYTLKGEKAGIMDLTVRSIDDQNFAITSFGSTSDAVSADFDPNKKGVKFVLKTKIDVQKAGVNTTGQIEIKTTHPECPTVTVPFTVLPRLKVDPPAINILNAEAGKAQERELWLLNNYNEDFEIASATSKEGTIKVISQEKVGTRYKFNLSVLPPTPANPGGRFTDTFTITTKDGEKVEVVCRGFYQRN